MLHFTAFFFAPVTVAIMTLDSPVGTVESPDDEMWTATPDLEGIDGVEEILVPSFVCAGSGKISLAEASRSLLSGL